MLPLTTATVLTNTLATSTSLTTTTPSQTPDQTVDGTTNTGLGYWEIVCIYIVGIECMVLVIIAGWIVSKCKAPNRDIQTRGW